MWQAPFPHLYIFEHFQTFVWSNSHFVLPISDLTAFIWAAAPIGGKVQKWSKASGHWAASYVQMSGPCCTTFSRYMTHNELCHNISDHIGWSRSEVCCDVVCVRPPGSLLWSVPLQSIVHLRRIIIGPLAFHFKPRFDWVIRQPRRLLWFLRRCKCFGSCAASRINNLLSAENQIKCLCQDDLLQSASLSKPRVIELFGKFLISQLHSQNLKMPCGDKIWTGILSGVGSEEGTGD